MESNGIQLHEVESEDLHYNLMEESAPDDNVDTETRDVAAPNMAPEEAVAPEPTTPPQEADYTELLAALQGLEAQAWDVKKRCEVLQDMIEDVTESPTFETNHRELFLDTSKTLCTDLQEMYRTIRVVLKAQAPDYQTGVWKKTTRSRK